MSFIDLVTIRLRAGHGGAGSTSFRREKFVEFGGPDGGDGGDGGDIVFVADPNIGTLLDLRYRKEIIAPNGTAGKGSKKTGSDGDDVEIRVPVGSLVRDAFSGDLLVDLALPMQRHIIAHGGKGGLGNWHFRTSVNQAPRYAQPGLPGDELAVTVELKLLADVGIIGFPSVGKSTLISVLSNARPKIADYPFTTLVPNLGIVKGTEYGKGFVVADIPGLVEGASEGRGLGFQFLRHVERCRLLLHIIEVTPRMGEGWEDGRDPIGDFDTICRELARFSPHLAARPMIVALGKTDLPFVAEQEPALRAHFEGLGFRFVSFSAVTRKGIPELIQLLATEVDRTPVPDPAEFTAPEPLPEPPPSEDDSFEKLVADAQRREGSPWRIDD